MPEQFLKYRIFYSDGIVSGMDAQTVLEDFSKVLTRYGIDVPDGRLTEGLLHAAIQTSGHADKITFEMV